ncbi:hypothetical protein NI389_14335 [Pseudoalteromonas xiamenensis]|uniref:hypothetical protein n=1 Tax=Pseudoalteromonas xiamenensis TaxID=882626 RepID=UPI0027E4962E|nr:hypothetical protein [Pseudoalteromonas xiamenensis]WMN59377.1 hypothetical protein NI389_14335 [Pseudoalteromonas xiamenensis]
MQQDDKFIEANSLLSQLEKAIETEDLDLCSGISKSLHIEIKNIILNSEDYEQLQSLIYLLASATSKVAKKKDTTKKELLKYQTGKKVASAYKKL